MRAPVQSDVLAPEDVEKLLRSWLTLLHDIMELPLPALRQLIEAELRGKRRPSVILRVYGRLNRLRAIEEKRALLEGETLWGEEKKW